MVRSSTHAIAAMMVRAGAVYLAILIGAGLTQMPTWMAANMTLVLAGSLLSAAVLAALMWVFSDAIARITLSSSTAPIDSDIDERGWLRIGLFTVGVFFVAESLSGFGQAFVTASVQSAEPSAGAIFGSVPQRPLWSLLALPAVHLVIGLALMLGARGIVRVVTSTRGWLASPPGAPSNERAPSDPE